MELHRTGKSFTSDTLCRLREDFPDGEIYFLMGTDMLLYMENWHDFRRIFSLCTLLVLPRNPGEEKEIAGRRPGWNGSMGRGWRWCRRAPARRALRTCGSGWAAGRARAAAGDGIPTDHPAAPVRGAARAGVAAGADGGVSQPGPGCPHVRGCEQEAVRLARRWGEDPGEAAEAGILHDITKKMGPAEQLRLCEKYGIITDTAEREEPRLLHARTGAYLARDLFWGDGAGVRGDSMAHHGAAGDDPAGEDFVPGGLY